MLSQIITVRTNDCHTTAQINTKVSVDEKWFLTRKIESHVWKITEMFRKIPVKNQSKNSPCNPKIGGCNGGGSGKLNLTMYSLGLDNNSVGRSSESFFGAFPRFFSCFLVRLSFCFFSWKFLNNLKLRMGEFRYYLRMRET